MKRIVFLLIVMIVAGQNLTAQSPAKQLAGRIAQKMKDTLGLTEIQKDSLYVINMQIGDHKADARRQYTAPDLLRTTIQQVENTRDSLYRRVLTEQQYALYRQKKRNLVNNN